MLRPDRPPEELKLPKGETELFSEMAAKAGRY